MTASEIAIFMLLFYIFRTVVKSERERRNRVRASLSRIQPLVPRVVDRALQSQDEDHHEVLQRDTSRRIVGRGGNRRKSGRIYDQSRPKFSDDDTEENFDPRWDWL